MNEKTKNKEIFELLFKNITLNKYECKICKKLFLYKLSSGYTNPMSHIRTHDNWEEVFLSLKGNNVEDNQTLDKYILKSVSDEAQLIYRWLTYIVMRNQPFSICEDHWTQQFAQINQVSRPTIMKYLEKVCKEVQSVVAKKIPERFGVILDGK